MEDTDLSRGSRRFSPGLVVLAALLIYAFTLAAPPSLMDDVDSVQAQIARNMLESGDWVTARLNGVAYLEKAPLKYWMIASSFLIFGVHDWAARLPIVISIVVLCWLVVRMGRWAFGAEAGFYAGLVMATSVGLFLFTRILIPDVVLTLAIAACLWAFLRTLEEDGRLWPLLFWGCMGAGFLLKGLIAMVFPVAAAGLFLLLTGQLFRANTWKRLRPVSGVILLLAIAAPWVILATLRNPPYFDFTMRSAPGEYHGFFWFFFLNEHLFRFLNMRHPRDYNTVPRLYFWLFHLLWFFPWSAYFPAVFRPSNWKGCMKPSTRAGRMKLLALCWAGFILVFFTFSTTQEYYSMPSYPALALLLGHAMARENGWLKAGSRVVAAVTGLAATVLLVIWWNVREAPAPGDISQALTLNPEAYTLSLGHMKDLTLGAFAYLKLPLLVAALAFVLGTVASLRWSRTRTFLGLAAMMIVFFHAARIAMQAFDPYLSSAPLARALRDKPPGQVIFDNQYYTFSSVFFYADLDRVWLLNGRVNNLEYGSYAPGAPDVFLDDQRLVRLWNQPERSYLVVEAPSFPRLKKLLAANLHQVAASGGKFIYSNRPD